MNLSLIAYEILVILVFFLGGVIGFYVRRYISESKIGGAEKEAQKIKELASQEAELKSKEIISKAKEEAVKIKSDVDRELKNRKVEIQKLETRLLQREESIEKKIEAVDKRERAIFQKEEEIRKMREALVRQYEKHKQELLRIANLSEEEARRELFEKLEEELKVDLSKKIKEYEDRLREIEKQKAQEIIATAVQRSAVDFVSESTITVVPLPNDEVKGRIIGREGRNIRTFESLTETELIIDDTPEAVVISSFDPIRREIAKMTLEKLIVDGRIHPSRIEELYEKAKEEMEEKILEEGEKAISELNIGDMPKELIKLVGKLKFRTSFGQNVLQHSLEVSNLAGIIASELHMNYQISRRAGLLHDIGKAIDKETEGPHALIGADILRKFGENEEIIHAVASHHYDVPLEKPLDYIIQAADAISASRPGVRNESIEQYIKRIEELEKIATSFEGVEKAYALQAGREVRVFVKPDSIDDNVLPKLAYDIAKKIENEIVYPGQIKVLVVRESKAFGYAK
ncbi:MAG TPA: ribonuclease Y [Caldisericia bacterium]|nr:ribonuclease Y [Caldisericia bacterium]HOL82702.1 ribonuclease Y [Caldisericia bacterium]HPP43326.1 ribonuclease Y [Caldisericia bacterium]